MRTEAQKAAQRRNAKAYYNRHREERCAKSRAFRKANPELVWAMNQKRHPVPTRPRPKYCERCGRDPSIHNDKHHCVLCVDHDHKTGEFRGWICSPCNRAIGLLGDSREAIANVLKYFNRAELS